MTLFKELGVSTPVLAAPMAGGPTTPELVVAASTGGSLGFLAGGYKTPDLLEKQIVDVRSKASTFGVNLFVPNPVRVDPDDYARYRDVVRRESARYHVDLPEEPVEDQDYWREKVDLLLADPVPVVSFTFGIPDNKCIELFQRAGSIVVQTVTSAHEAKRAATSGVDVLAVQSAAAGGHSGTFAPGQLPMPESTTELLTHVRSVVDLPLVAAGGLSTSADVASVLRAGAVAAMVGTVLLLSDESGASAAYRKAVFEGTRDTVVTRAFTGRPARALRNEFIDAHDAVAPFGYPAIHHLTSPLRQAAAAAMDVERVNLWAGTGYRHATREPAAEILGRLIT